MYCCWRLYIGRYFSEAGSDISNSRIWVPRKKLRPMVQPRALSRNGATAPGLSRGWQSSIARRRSPGCVVERRLVVEQDGGHASRASVRAATMPTGPAPTIATRVSAASRSRAAPSGASKCG